MTTKAQREAAAKKKADAEAQALADAEAQTQPSSDAPDVSKRGKDDLEQIVIVHPDIAKPGRCTRRALREVYAPKGWKEASAKELEDLKAADEV